MLTEHTNVKGFVHMKLVDKYGKSKKLFKENIIWKLIKRTLNLDVRIPYLTGMEMFTVVRPNLVTTKGKELIAKQLNGVTTAPVTAVALGTGTTAPAAGDTALETEITTGGGGRGAATTAAATTTTTDDTAQWVKTFTFTSSFALTEEGLFDNNTTGGNMLARNTFSAVNVVSGDQITITHNVQLT